MTVYELIHYLVEHGLDGDDEVEFKVEGDVCVNVASDNKEQFVDAELDCQLFVDTVTHNGRRVQINLRTYEEGLMCVG